MMKWMKIQNCFDCQFGKRTEHNRIYDPNFPGHFRLLGNITEENFEISLEKRTRILTDLENPASVSNSSRNKSRKIRDELPGSDGFKNIT